ncbi:hypothetical protein ACNOYE_09600 [Nannocystaceae bacterium ST9]
MNRHFHNSCLASLLLIAQACDLGNDEANANDESQETETSSSSDSGSDSESSSSSSSTDDAESTSSSSSSDDAETTSSSSDDGVVREECECIPDQELYDPPMMPTCGELLCPTVSQVDGIEGVPELATPEALICALTALRDRTPGIVTWDSTFNGGQFSEHGYVLIYETGEAVFREWGANDLSYDVTPALRFELPAPEHYDACLANPDDYDRYYCLRQQPNPSLAICDAGWSESSN